MSTLAYVRRYGSALSGLGRWLAERLSGGAADLVGAGEEAQGVDAHDAALGAVLTRTADAIVSATRRLTRWSDGRTDVARLQIGQTLLLDRRRVDLVAMARRVAGEHAAQSERRAIRVRAAVPEVVGHWDGGRLERVLHNLVGNALKYSADDGDVEIAVDLVRPPPAPGDGAARDAAHRSEAR